MGVGGQSHTPTALTPGKTRYPSYRRMGGFQGRSGRVRKISPPPGFNPLNVRPVASRYTEWAIPTPPRWKTKRKGENNIKMDINSQSQERLYCVESVCHIEGKGGICTFRREAVSVHGLDNISKIVTQKTNKHFLEFMMSLLHWIYEIITNRTSLRRTESSRQNMRNIFREFTLLPSSVSHFMVRAEWPCTQLCLWGLS
jgi:hypothetical protein